MPRIAATEVAPGHLVPLLRVDIEVNGYVGILPAILDSGADRVMVPFEFLQPAGVAFGALPLAPGKQLGAGGEFPARVCRAKISWKGTTICDEVYVIAQGSKLPFILLGRDDFFTKYSIRFNWQRTPPTVDIDPAAIPKR